MLLAWSVAEIIRFSFYIPTLLPPPYARPPPALISWLRSVTLLTPTTLLIPNRYTAYRLTYPVGASSEAMLIFASLPVQPSLYRPYDWLRLAMFVIWWPGLYVMMSHMARQRRRYLLKSTKNA